MKKILLYCFFSLLALLLAVSILIYSWTQTPYGTLNYKAAVGVRLLYEPPNFEQFTVKELRQRYKGEEAQLNNDYLKWVASVEDSTVHSSETNISIRLYYPEGEGDFPVIIYYHGGGFVFGTLNEYNTLCAKLSHYAQAIVVSVDYRLAPEHPYPAPVDDAWVALNWIYIHAAQLGGDSTRLAVMGDSAGGNLAAVVSQIARDQSKDFIDFQALLYPATQSVDLETDSHQKYGQDYGITTRQIAWYIRQYLPNESDRVEAYASPLLAERLGKLPPALVVTAGFDPLKSEGEAYAKKLESSGVIVALVEFESMIHGFANIEAFSQSEEVLQLAAEKFREAIR